VHSPIGKPRIRPISRSRTEHYKKLRQTGSTCRIVSRSLRTPFHSSTSSE
jgi:hypothetical protein